MNLNEIQSNLFNTFSDIVLSKLFKMKRKSTKKRPDGSVRISFAPNGRKITHIKENGKWVYQREYPNGFIDKWGNYRKVGSGDNNPVIGKSGPRPELRSLSYGVGINDVMIPQFTKTRIWKVWQGIIRRTDNRDPVWISKKKGTYKDCTLDPKWFKLSVFKEWMEQWDDFENKEVDKDILIPGNLHYGPDTCLMVRKIVNSWFKPHLFEGDLPRGVCWNSNYKKGKSPKPYRAQINPLQVIDGEVKVGKRTALGHFLTVEEASDAFQKARQESLQILIDTETDIKVRDAILQYITT